MGLGAHVPKTEESDLNSLNTKRSNMNRKTNLQLLYYKDAAEFRLRRKLYWQADKSRF
jgi:hypothetical protein